MPRTLSKINKWLALSLFLVLTLIFQRLQILQLGSVTPNWILIGLLSVPFSFDNKEFFPKGLVLIIFTAVLYFTWFPFARTEGGIIFLLFCMSFLVKKFLIGNIYLNVSIVVLIGTVSFYVFLSILSGRLAPVGSVMVEALYNTILSLVAAGILYKIKYYE